MLSSSYTIPRGLPFVEGFNSISIPEGFPGSGGTVVSDRMTIPSNQFATLHLPSDQGIYPISNNTSSFIEISQTQVEFYFMPRVFSIPPGTEFLLRADRASISGAAFSGGRTQVRSGRGDLEIFYPGGGASLNLFLWEMEVTYRGSATPTGTLNLTAGFSLFITYHSISDFVDD